MSIIFWQRLFEIKLSFTCECFQGYQSPLVEKNGNFIRDRTTCQDVDECELDNICSDDAKCVNTAGSFICVCSAGYVGSYGNCTNLNECLMDNPCPKSTACIGKKSQSSFEPTVRYHKVTTYRHFWKLQMWKYVTFSFSIKKYYHWVRSCFKTTGTFNSQSSKYGPTSLKSWQESSLQRNTPDWERVQLVAGLTFENIVYLYPRGYHSIIKAKTKILDSRCVISADEGFVFYSKHFWNRLRNIKRPREC